MSQTQGDQARELSRRTVAAGAAWTVPVIAVGAAAPAMAAAQNIIVIELDPLASCKFPGQSTEFNHAYDLVFTITAAEAGILCITDVFAPNNTPTRSRSSESPPVADRTTAVLSSPARRRSASSSPRRTPPTVRRCSLTASRAWQASSPL